MTPPLRIEWSGDAAYARLIESFISAEFPTLSTGRIEDQVAAIVSAFFSTKQFRIGPKPLPESEVKIRDVVRRAIEQNRPIPILIAWAAVKLPFGAYIDLAELSALRVLACLQQRIIEHYPPGVSIRIRLEDLTEYAISADVPNLESHVSRYTSDFVRLVSVLGYSEFILPIKESELVDSREFGSIARLYSDVFLDYLRGDSFAEEELLAAGWKGGVSLAMRNYLIDRYKVLYPNHENEYLQIMSRYFAAILTRRNLGGMGEDRSFEGRLEISFAPALPDTPLISTRVYYRTVPLAQSSFHASPWAARGHLKISNDNSTRISLSPNAEVTPGNLTIHDSLGTLTIGADFSLDD